MPVARRGRRAIKAEVRMLSDICYADVSQMGEMSMLKVGNQSWVALMV